MYAYRRGWAKTRLVDWKIEQRKNTVSENEEYQYDIEIVSLKAFLYNILLMTTKVSKVNKVGIKENMNRLNNICRPLREP